MELAWENITHAQAELLASTWDANYGIYGRVQLGAAGLAGMSIDLSALVEQPFPNTVWSFAGPPVIESVKRGRCTVRIPLINKRPVTFRVLTPGTIPRLRLTTSFTLQPSGPTAVTTIIDEGLVTPGLTAGTLIQIPFFVIGASGSAFTAVPPEGTLEFPNPVESLDLSIPSFGVNTLLPPEGTLEFENLTESLELSISSFGML
jgi:hypothetical protein